MELIAAAAAGLATAADAYKALNGDSGAELAVPLDVIGLAAPFGGEAIARLLGGGVEAAVPGIGLAFGASAFAFGTGTAATLVPGLFDPANANAAAMAGCT